MENDLDGCTAIVTGAASGIGAATARKLAQEGAQLVLVDKSEAGLCAVANTLPGAPLVAMADVVRGAEIAHVVDLAVDMFQRIDILVNCAGISTHIPFLELSEEAWDEVVDVNLKGTFLCCRAVAPLMVRQGKGAIVNVSSGIATTGAFLRAHYAASKAGVLGLTKTMALELAPYGVRVNAVAPGAVDTPLFRRNRTGVQIEAVARRIPLSLGQPDHVASVVCFLVGPDSAHMTGQTLHVNGGSLMP